MTTEIYISPKAAQYSGRQVLIVGSDPERLSVALPDAYPDVAWRYAMSVGEALAIARTGVFASVVVDLPEDEGQAALQTIKLAELRTVERIVVIGSGEAAARFGVMPGIDSVVASPEAAKCALSEILADSQPDAAPDDAADAERNEHQAPALGDVVPTLEIGSEAAGGAPEPADDPEAEDDDEEEDEPEDRRWFSIPVMTIVSNVYKTFAVVFLCGLFAVFVFYGVLITFFLLSNSWAAPTTLSSGHELVNKVEQKLAELRMRKNMHARRLRTAAQQAEEAKRELQDAHTLVKLVRGTIDVEVHHRRKAKTEIDLLVKRLRKVEVGITKITQEVGIEEQLAQIFKNRLIDRKYYNSGVLAILETSHRLAMIKNEIAEQGLAGEKIMSSLKMLRSLRDHVSAPLGHVVAPGGSDLIPLASQLVEAKAAVANAKTKLAEIQTRRKIINDSWKIAEKSIKRLQETPLGRAIESPVVVLFVPYANASQFRKGRPIRACLLSILLCEKVGVVGKPVSGEVRAVHPFFGKPVRGYFVNVRLEEPEAAKRDLLHVGMAPLLF